MILNIVMGCREVPRWLDLVNTVIVALASGLEGAGLSRSSSLDLPSPPQKTNKQQTNITRIRMNVFREQRTVRITIGDPGRYDKALPVNWRQYGAMELEWWMARPGLWQCLKLRW